MFWRYAERGNDCAQRYAPLRVLLCRVRTGSRMHRFGKLLIAGFPLTRIIKPRRGQPVGALAASFWRRERKAEPTTMRSVLLSVRQGPVLVSKLTNVPVKTFASFVRVIHPLALPPRRSPACAARARRSERCRDARVDRVHDFADVKLVPSLLRSSVFLHKFLIKTGSEEVQTGPEKRSPKRCPHRRAICSAGRYPGPVITLELQSGFRVT